MSTSVVVGPQPRAPSVVYHRDERVVVVTTPARFVTVTSRGPQGRQGEQGEQGDPGPVGPAGGEAFVYTQTSPASVWIINHELGRKPQVTVLDVTDTAVYADVTHGSLNQTSITFANPFAGSALLS